MLGPMSIGALSSGAAAPAFDPQDIAGMFSRFDHTTAIYTDTAGTTPAASNDDAVRRWDDGTGTQNATEETSHPVLKTGANGIGGERVVYFSSAWLLLTGLSVASGPMTFYLVVEPDSIPGVEAGYFLDSNTGRLILCHGTTVAGKTGYYDGSFKNIANATTSVQIMTFVLQSSGGEMFRDGVSIGSDTYTETAIGGDTRLASNRVAASQFYNGKMGAFYGYSGVHDVGQRAQVHGYLSSAFSTNLA